MGRLFRAESIQPTVRKLLHYLTDRQSTRTSSFMQAYPEISICNDKIFPISRQPDGEGFQVCCIGGFRAGMVDDHRWAIDPVLDKGRPTGKGFLTRSQLFDLMDKTRLTPIAFQRHGWHRGEYHSSWSPIIPGRKNHALGPADLWGNIAMNRVESPADVNLQDTATPTLEQVGAIFDDRTEEERLALSISLSLRSMDISVEQIAEFYHEQLVDLMAAGLTDGRHAGGSQDQTLFSHVHSFFLHLGAARDYLAALVAARLSKDPSKVDSMGRLVDMLRPKHFGSDALLDLLADRKYIDPIPEKPNRRQMSGWLQDVSALRNQFVHSRPYGSRYVESFGRIVAVAPEAGLYRYKRPVVIENNADADALDVVAYHYKCATGLFQDLAEASGSDTSMLRLTDKDIISVDVKS